MRILRLDLRTIRREWRRMLRWLWGQAWLGFLLRIGRGASFTNWVWRSIECALRGRLSIGLGRTFCWWGVRRAFWLGRLVWTRRSNGLLLMRLRVRIACTLRG